MIPDVGEAQEAAEEFISLLCVEVNIYSFFRPSFISYHLLCQRSHTSI